LLSHEKNQRESGRLRFTAFRVRESERECGSQSERMGEPESIAEPERASESKSVRMRESQR